MPSAELLAAMGKYMNEMVEAGILRAGDGLQASAKGARVRFSGGKPSVSSGPFADPQALLAGFCLIEVSSKQEAIEWVKRWPPLDGDGEVEIEIRQLFEPEDFGADLGDGPALAEACQRGGRPAAVGK